MLFANHTGKVNFNRQECSIVSIVVIILTLYAYLWIKENLEFEGKIKDEIDGVFKEEYNYIQLKTLRPDNAKFR